MAKFAVPGTVGSYELDADRQPGFGGEQLSHRRRRMLQYNL